MFMSKGKFIKWVVILFILCMLGGICLSKLDNFSFGGGLAIGYVVTSIAYGFSITNACTSLRELDVSGFDTSNVTDMSLMF